MLLEVHMVLRRPQKLLNGCVRSFPHSLALVYWAPSSSWQSPQVCNTDNSANPHYSVSYISDTSFEVDNL